MLYCLAVAANIRYIFEFVGFNECLMLISGFEVELFNVMCAFYFECLMDLGVRISGSEILS
jgi:hypothetical protein